MFGFTKVVKLMGLFLRNPSDVFFLPLSVIFGYFHGLVKLYALLTLNMVRPISMPKRLLPSSPIVPCRPRGAAEQTATPTMNSASRPFPSHLWCLRCLQVMAPLFAITFVRRDDRRLPNKALARHGRSAVMHFTTQALHMCRSGCQCRWSEKDRTLCRFTDNALSSSDFLHLRTKSICNKNISYFLSDDLVLHTDRIQFPNQAKATICLARWQAHRSFYIFRDGHIFNLELRLHVHVHLICIRGTGTDRLQSIGI